MIDTPNTQPNRINDMKETTEPNTTSGDGGDCLERLVRRDCFFNMVQSPMGPKRAGNAYATKEAAKSWSDFVSRRHGGHPVKVEKFTVELLDGKVTPECAKILDERFNLDV